MIEIEGMKMKWKELYERFPDTVKSDWVFQKDTGAWIHKDAMVSDRARILGPVIFRSGTFDGGVFYDGFFYDGIFYGGNFDGGVFYDGFFYDGIFYGGDFHGGVFNGGIFYGGIFYDGFFYGGAFDGGTFRGGTFNGGTFYGGVFNGGIFYDGGFHDGIYEKTPTQLFGLLPYTINASGPSTIQIGCENHTIEWWRENWKMMAEEDEIPLEKVEVLWGIIDNFVFPQKEDE